MLFLYFSIFLQWKPPICLVSADAKADAAFIMKNNIITQIWGLLHYRVSVPILSFFCSFVRMQKWFDSLNMI